MTPTTTTMNHGLLTLGSLFDGSGGFPLAAKHVGIRPVWASEIEPFPILVTRKNLPEVKHLGDIRGINGAEVEPVDVMTFGSPCQDLSVAGKQSGLAGSRSGLFFEAVRIIKEMREATNGHYPRYAVWENVPGAFSSNKGQDFATVLTALAQVKEEAAPGVPVPQKGWSNAGVLMGEGFSLAWRVLDAQYFGLAQRRRRIYLTCDFTNRCAPKILFDPQSSTRNPQQGSPEKQNHARGALPGTRGSRQRKSKLDIVALDHHPQDSRLTVNATGVMQTLTARMGNSPTNVPLLLDGQKEPVRVFGLNSVHLSRREGGTYGYEASVSKTLDLKGGEPTCNQGGMIILEEIYSSSKADFFTRGTLNRASALMASDCYEPPLVASRQLRPRRLTPIECARLQGFPDDWCENLAIKNPTNEELDYWCGVWQTWNRMRAVKAKSHKQVAKWLASPGGDRAQYKLWGNGIALPCAEYVLGRLKTQHFNECSKALNNTEV